MSTEKIEPVAEFESKFLRPEWIGPARHWDANEPVVGLDCVHAALRAAVAAERERCAKVCWKLAGEYAIGIDETGDRAHGKMVAANSCAAAIRQLGDEQ